MGYGLKKIKTQAGIKIVKPRMELRYNSSGYGEARDKPYYLDVGGKTIRRFKTKESAIAYYNSYRKRMLSSARKMLK